MCLLPSAYTNPSTDVRQSLLIGARRAEATGIDYLLLTLCLFAWRVYFTLNAYTLAIAGPSPRAKAAKATA